MTYNRQLHTELEWGDYHYISSPVAANTASNSGKISSVWAWDEPGGEWDDLTVNFRNFASGIGYNLDQTGTSDGKISFTGTVVTSGFSIAATSPYTTPAIESTRAEYDARWANNPSRSLYGGGGWNLLGNPFTSAMNATTFISTNALSFDPNYQAVYIYDGSTGETGTYHINHTTIQAWPGILCSGYDEWSSFFIYTWNAASQYH